MFDELQSHCPKCHKSSWRLKRHQGHTFCPHCHIILYQKRVNNKVLQLSKPIAVVVSIGIGMTLFIASYNIPFAIAGLFVLFAVLTIIKERQVLTHGIDELDDCIKDNCDYVSHDNRTLQCQTCNSFRLVDLACYQSILPEEPRNLAIISLEDRCTFVGCLHCRSHYEIQPIITQPKSVQAMYVLSLVFMLIELFLPDDHCIAHIISFCFAILLMVFMYHCMSQTGYFVQQQKYEPLTLKKV